MTPEVEAALASCKSHTGCGLHCRTLARALRESEANSKFYEDLYVKNNQARLKAESSLAAALSTIEGMREALKSGKCGWYPNTDLCEADPCLRCKALHSENKK